MSTKIVYITGCCGFIGSYITRACLEKGWYVKGVDKFTYAANPLLLDEFKQYSGFSISKGDINDLKFLYDCDYVINTAAETHVGNSIVQTEEFIHSNINGVYHLLELIRKCREDQKPTLLHFSTDEVYGDILEGAHTEQDLLKPSNPYSATKAAADMLIAAWVRTYKVPCVIVRPTNNYGIGQYVEKLIPKACKYLNLGRKIPLHNKGTPVRNWLHADDTARAVLTIIESGITNQIFNVAGHFEQTNAETIRKIIQCYFRDERNIEDYIEYEERPGQDMRYALDDTKLTALGWLPIHIFDTELPKIIQYYKEHFIW